jgi:hypothetical protein
MIKKTELIDGQWLPANPTPPHPRGKVSLGLKTIESVRLEMSRVYRECRTGALDPAIATKLTFILGQIGRLIEAGDLERRVEQLESYDEITTEKARRKS